MKIFLTYLSKQDEIGKRPKSDRIMRNNFWTQKGNKDVTAAVLTPISTQLLHWITRGTFNRDHDFVFKTRPLPHHMTICLGRIEDSSLHDRSILGCEALLKIDTLIHNRDLEVCATPVYDSTAMWTTGNGKYENILLKSANTVPHITVCIRPGFKPFFSIQMLEKLNSNNVVLHLDQSYTLQATITEID